MPGIPLRTAAAFSAVFLLGVTSTLVAQTLTDSPQRVEQKRADLSGAPGMDVHGARRGQGQAAV